MAMMDYMTTKKDELVGWIRKFSLFPYPFVTACCGMEFMSVSSTLYDTDRFGAALPRFTPRQADLLMVVGTISHKEAPILKKVYDQMCEPKWVMAFGACATSGGFYRNYWRAAGHRPRDSGRHLRARLPAAPRDRHRRHHDAAGQDRGRSPSDPARGATRARALAREQGLPDLPRRGPRAAEPDVTGRAPLSYEAIERELGRLVERSWQSFGMPVLELRAENLLAARHRLRDEFDFALFLDVTAVDYPERSPRFDVVYHFYSRRHNQRIRLKVRVPAERPVVPTLAGHYGSARYMEREVHDMYGIEFAGNADLRPILLYEGFVGHPLRKDYPIEREQPMVPYRSAVTPWTPPRPSQSHLDRTADAGNVVVNIGPSHPATHGTIQIVAELDGETVKRADVHCGYLHRGFEKEAEHHTYHKVIPYIDRLNYCSALNNGFAYAEAVEKLLGHRDHAPLQRAAHAALRVQPHRRPPDLHRRIDHGDGRDDRVPLPDDGARLHLRAPESPDRRAPHVLVRPHRRPGARPARRLARRASRRSSSSPRNISSASTGCSTATASSSIAPATSR